MSNAIVPPHIRLAMIGMVEENGHPYSWSSIINGRYDTSILRQSNLSVVANYLDAQPAETIGIDGAEVTHIWCDRPEDAQLVARCAGIPTIVETPCDVIGHVDAVIIPTDKGEEHLNRTRSFVEAGLSVFIDKPLTVRPDHLAKFIAWHGEGKRIMSSSAMRYAQEFQELKVRIAEVGSPRLIVATCAKSWERYGIHALEAVYQLLPPGGWLDACNTGSPASNVVHLRHDSKVDVVIVVTDDMFGGFCHVSVYGTEGRLDARFKDSFTAFKSQLQAFVDYVRGSSGNDFFGEVVEQMKIIIAGIQSRNESGRRIELETLLT